MYTENHFTTEELVRKCIYANFCLFGSEFFFLISDFIVRFSNRERKFKEKKKMMMNMMKN